MRSNADHSALVEGNACCPLVWRRSGRLECSQAALLTGDAWGISDFIPYLLRAGDPSVADIVIAPAIGTVLGPWGSGGGSLIAPARTAALLWHMHFSGARSGPDDAAALMVVANGHCNDLGWRQLWS